MKKLFALILALALLAGCAAPAEELPHTLDPSPSAEPYSAPEPSPSSEATPLELPFGFGEIAESYSPHSRPRTFSDCYGDTGMLRAKYLLREENVEPQTLMFSFEAYEPIALTTAHYEGGMLIDKPLDYDLGYIERMEDGEWTRYYTLGTYGFEPQRLRPYDVEEGEFTETFDFRRVYDTESERYVGDEPGSYRITLSFRKSLDDDGYNYTTSKELYSIQMLFFIPEASDAAFDLVNVGFIDNYERDQTYSISPYVRRNGDTTFFFDYARTRLEVLTDGEWVEAPPRDGMDSAVEFLMSEDAPYGRYVSEISNAKTPVYVADRSAAHRIVYEYCENADGSGRRGELVIPLEFTLPAQFDESDPLAHMEAIGRLEGPATRANSSIRSAGLSDHPNFGGSFITDDYHLGVCIKSNDPELKAAILDYAGDSGVVQFVETNASYSDLIAQQSALQDLFWDGDGSKSSYLKELGIEYTGSSIRQTVSAVIVDLFVRSRAAFDVFIAEFGKELGENVYFEVRYGIDLEEVSVDPYTVAPPPPTEPVDTGISLVASNVTRTGATVTFFKDDGGSMSAYTTGAAWSMDVWDGKRWIEVPMAQTMWFMLGYYLGDFDIHWESVFGALPNGYYRICKHAHLQGDDRAYYAQFTIDDDTPATLAGE